MDSIFFSWLAAQPYWTEVAVGATFVVFIAPAVLAGFAGLAIGAERLIAELLRITGVLQPLEREKKTLWRLLPRRQGHPRNATSTPSVSSGEHSTRATG
jgi:hypothetical protein